MIIFNYPYWYVIFCFLLGIGYAVFLYRKDNSFGDEKKVLPYFLGTLRFLSIFILALLLLEPLIQTTDQIIEKPILVIAQDNSESIGLSKDSLFYKNEYKDNLKVLENKLSEKYEVRTFSFGNKIIDSLSFNYNLKQTDISEVFKTVEQKFYGRNLGGVILASDGIINKGLNPEFAVKKLKNTLVYTIALGDTTVRKDLIVNTVHHNKMAYKGNDFPIEINLKANHLQNKEVAVSVWKKGKKLQEKTINFKTNNASENVNFILPAKNSGKQKYTVKVSEIEGELTHINNSKDFYIQIIENKQDILILANAPHPDIAALKSVLVKNKNYHISVKLATEFKEKTNKYSLVILLGLPNNLQKHNKLIDALLKQKTPLLFCTNEQTNYNQLNKLKQKVSVIAVNGTSTATPLLNSNFNKFKVSESLKSSLTDFPPLQVPFTGNFKVAQSNNVFLYQKIDGNKTNYPLFILNENGAQKVGFLLGEGIWRWKLVDFQKNKNHNNFDEIIQKSIQYLVVKKDKSQFRITNKEHLYENESLVIDAELYNDSYELVNSSDVAIKIINELGEDYPIKTMNKSGASYRLKAGIFSAGEYTYVATTSFDGKTYEKKGKFSVEELKVEYLNLVANHKLLYNLAISKDGKLFYPNQLKELEQEIYNQENIVPISYSKKSVEDIIKWKWIFFLILSLLSIEWFLRKRNGSY